MFLKRKAVAFAAALTLISGVGAAAAMTAGAATPPCGPTCIDLFSREFGTHHHPAFVLDVFRQAAHVGQPNILYRTSNTDPAEDFTAGLQGNVSDFYQAGLVSSALALHYGCGWNKNTGTCGNSFPNDVALEIEYAPFGADSGLCMGVARTAFQGERVTLQPCGVSSKTVWVVDTGDSVTVSHGYVPLVNGSDTNFSHPFVLTYPVNGFPTDRPRPQLQVRNLTGFSGSFGIPVLGSVDDSQLWGADLGVLH
jgi:hypothetical protein